MAQWAIRVKTASSLENDTVMKWVELETKTSNLSHLYLSSHINIFFRWHLRFLLESIITWYSVAVIQTWLYAIMGAFCTQKLQWKTCFYSSVTGGWWQQNDQVKHTENVLCNQYCRSFRMEGVSKVLRHHHYPPLHSGKKKTERWKNEKPVLLCPLMALSNLERTLLIEVTGQIARVADPGLRQPRSLQGPPLL